MAEPEGSAPLSKKALKEGIRDVLGGGSDIDAANPLYATLGTNVLPEIKASLFNAAILAATDILAAEINTTMTYPVIWRIYCSFTTSGVVTLFRRVGANTQTDTLNANVALTAGAGYMFDVMVEDGEEIQFQYSVAGVINTFKVVEIKGMT